ncbi:MAG: hypothetical protein R2830_15250 [Saprospiraceae bacterium]
MSFPGVGSRPDVGEPVWAWRNAAFDRAVQELPAKMPGDGVPAE